jgi:hypothetical protein
MDIDPPLPTSGSKRMTSPSLAASTSKRSKHGDPAPIQPLQALAARMRKYATTQHWQITMDMAKDDESKWTDLIQIVLSALTSSMESTDRTSDFIGPQTLLQAEQIVDDFSDEYFREWKDGVQKGINNDDWEDLLKHRTFQI